ncbi:hypothetical protein T02_598 [Trichinella nativa]|uniref:Uncharacterized protein n=1 Tax=Trichinella nativa TaxID=6335 RepID=A0A0V1L9T8_9BILA|nr:hypothetical protein T02_598 [Trichinella nativa]
MTLRFSTLTTDPISVVYILPPPNGSVSRPSLTVADSSWTSFATGRVITLVNVWILADLTVPSLPKCNSALGSRVVVLQDQHQIVHFWLGWGRSPFLSLHQFRKTPTAPPFRKELLTVSPSVAPLRELPFWLAAILGHELQLPGSPRTHDRSATETVIKGGVRGLHPPRMSVKRFSEDLPQRFLDRADEAFPVASHPRGSLRDEFPVDAVAYQLTLDSVHVHVSPELPQL